MEKNKIYNIDCLSGLKKLESESIDLVVTSPPYDDIRVYKDDPLNFNNEHYQENVIEELFRVLKKGGVIVWVVGDKTENYSESGTSFRQTLKFKEKGFSLNDTMIFNKLNPAPKNHSRYEQAFEYMFIFAKGKVKTFNPLKEECKNVGKTRNSNYRNNVMGDLEPLHTEGKVGDLKLRTNIWSYSVGKSSTQDKEAHNHPAIFPEKLAEDHILSWSNEGDLVLDIFMGSGTTGKMAKINDRDYIGFDTSKEYCDLAEARIAKYIYN